jgi:hypothetical protein
VKSTPKLKLWANRSNKWMAIMNKGWQAQCQFLVNFWNFWKKYTRNWHAISTSQRFCARKIIQELGLDYFVHKKSYKNWDWTILCTKNHTRIGIGQFCAWKVIQKLVFNNFVQEKSYEIF